jgi:hypothetical protein
MSAISNLRVGGFAESQIKHKLNAARGLSQIILRYARRIPTRYRSKPAFDGILVKTGATQNSFLLPRRAIMPDSVVAHLGDANERTAHPAIP